MKNKRPSDLLPEYDFSKGTRGKYARQFAAGTNLIALDADVAKVFPDSDSVNEILRAVAKILHRSKRPTV